MCKVLARVLCLFHEVMQDSIESQNTEGKLQNHDFKIAGNNKTDAPDICGYFGSTTFFPNYHITARFSEKAIEH